VPGLEDAAGVSPALGRKPLALHNRCGQHRWRPRSNSSPPAVHRRNVFTVSGCGAGSGRSPRPRRQRAGRRSAGVEMVHHSRSSWRPGSAGCRRRHRLESAAWALRQPGSCGIIQRNRQGRHQATAGPTSAAGQRAGRGRGSTQVAEDRALKHPSSAEGHQWGCGHQVRGGPNIHPGLFRHPAGAKWAL